MITESKLIFLDWNDSLIGLYWLITVCRQPIPPHDPRGQKTRFFSLLQPRFGWMGGFGQKGNAAGLKLSGAVNPAFGEDFLMLELLPDLSTCHLLTHSCGPVIKILFVHWDVTPPNTHNRKCDSLNFINSRANGAFQKTNFLIMNSDHSFVKLLNRNRNIK